MSNRGFRILGLPLIWALLLGVVVFILWKPIVVLFKGLVQKVKAPEETAAEPAAPTTKETEIKNS